MEPYDYSKTRQYSQVLGIFLAYFVRKQNQEEEARRKNVEKRRQSGRRKEGTCDMLRGTAGKDWARGVEGKE